MGLAGYAGVTPFGEERVDDPSRRGRLATDEQCRRHAEDEREDRGLGTET